MTRGRGDLVACAVVTLAGAAVGALAAAALQGGCFSLVTEYRRRPDVGTPRAAFCAPFDHWWRWLLCAGVGAALSALGARFGSWLGLALAVVVALAVAILANSLTYFHPVG